MKSNGECALKIKQVVVIFSALLIVSTTSACLSKTIKTGTELANSDMQEEIHLGETFEREIKLTTRSETERTQTIKAAKAVLNYKTIEEIEISKDMDLTKNCGLSREDFIELLSSRKRDTSGFFEKNAGFIYDLCQKYELNEIFFCGLIAGESGWDIASGHRSTHNYISMMSNGHLISYSSDEEGLETAAKLLCNKYLSETGAFYRGKTLYCMQKVFCPNSSTWVNLIFTCMSQVIE